MEKGCFVHQAIFPESLGNTFNGIPVLQEPADKNANVVQQGCEWMGFGGDEALLDDTLRIQAEGDLDLHWPTAGVDVDVLYLAGDLRSAGWEFGAHEIIFPLREQIVLDASQEQDIQAHVTSLFPLYFSSLYLRVLLLPAIF